MSEREREREREKERKKERTVEEEKGGKRGERWEESRDKGGYEKEGTRGQRGKEALLLRSMPWNMYVHSHARVCVRARANINVYHEAHLYRHV